MRGRILDARGEILAYDDPNVPGQRRYPLGTAAAHPVGFVHPRYGLFGLESQADSWLSGYAFSTPQERRRFGQNLIGLDRVRGNDLRLTLVAGLQRSAANLLNGQRGAIVVLRPSDGALLALVSVPAFDPEDPSGALAADPAEAPMMNRALLGLSPPGSPFKIATAGLAIENGFRASLDCPGEGYVPQPGARPIRDHEYYAALREGRAWAGHGRLDLREAFVKSSNVFFAQVGTRLPAAEFADLGRRLHIQDPLVVFESADGRMTARAGQGFATGEWSSGRRAQLAIGQGSLLVTPLHMAVLVGAVANEGIAWQPRLAADAEPVGLGRFFKRETARVLRTLMLDAVRRGTGRRAAVDGIEVAGKTGTAQNPRGEDHAWFAGFAPFDQPAIAFVVLVEHGGSGGLAAAPLAAKLVRAAAE
ncbi:MAG: penicillin-binding protein 2, partial [Anaerolineae bacterium]|nr:penicillin-binding protein 2 [Anaerolineae bacterium]